MIHANDPAIDPGESQEAYYTHLSEGTRYIQEAKRFVPGYEELIDDTVGEVLAQVPADPEKGLRVVDLGCGPGHITRALLEKAGERGIPVQKVFCVDVAEPMLEKARETLSPFQGLVEFSHQGALGFDPSEPVDVVFSNLTLHNLPFAEKAMAIHRVSTWLSPNGLFSWADLIKFPDKEAWMEEMERRKQKGIEQGASREFAEVNFDKEVNQDHPTTTGLMEEIMKASGFETPEEVWKRSTFARIRAPLTLG